ncbi:uncharacterized protein LOC124310548 isoform X1 [Neodiprion virginianus]|uniref:uncharacterized protein LOC124310548 isoform X1 n=2 Tax=Neodiprion virginianus TaxID=2961670 RepID=UPI001EE748AB|nr:uncharacterized protein LOC124310548 isoform X1 [Neodiprion virginianus]
MLQSNVESVSGPEAVIGSPGTNLRTLHPAAPPTGWRTMHPTAPRSSRSSVHSLAPSPTVAPSPCPSPSPSPSLALPLPQQQQQHIIYGPITALQPCTAALHPPCVYPSNTQRGTSTSVSVPQQAQGKSTKWHGKSNNKPPRGQYCHGQPGQSAHPSYAGKSLVVYDQTQTGTPVSTSSFLVSSSAFAHGQFPAEHYNNSNVALVPPPYFKPPEVQTFCLVQDRQTAPQHNSYYNISATNTCSLQNVNSTSGFQLPNIAPYTVTAFPNNQIPAPVPVQSTQLFQTAPVGLVFGPPPREKHATTSVLDVSSSAKYLRNKHPGSTANPKIPTIPQLQNEWPPSLIPTTNCSSSSAAAATSITVPALSSNNVAFDTCKSPQDTSFPKLSVPTPLKQAQDRYSDDSSISFDFTIEAEKMVSALCNTASSNDLGGVCGKDEIRKSETSYFNGAGDNVGNKGSWFADLGIDYSLNGDGGSRTVGTQTEPNQVFAQQLPELIRKTAYWGCSEAESILNSVKYQNPKQTWLSNISSATRTAITKSSTCFPVFAGDGKFVHDLISALLRVTNGWLILDNYLNKQHYPNLTDKIDDELTRCFQGWEGSTYELLRNVVQTFLKLDEASKSNFNPTSGSQSETQNGSFPGDVSLYTNSDVFCPAVNTASCQHRSDNNILSSAFPFQQPQESAYAVHYTPQPAGVQNFRYFNTQQGLKETKPRSKWTLTESLVSATEGTKSVPDVTLTNSEAGLGGCKFRSKINSSSGKGTSRQSLNAEFVDLRNKVVESNSDTVKQWNMNADSRRKTDFLFRIKSTGEMEPVYKANSSTGLVSMYSTKISDTAYDTGGTTRLYTQDPEAVFRNATSVAEPAYVGRPTILGESSFNRKFHRDNDHRSKSLKCMDQNYLAKSGSGVGTICLGKSSTDHLELATVPKNKMTLLSQIEPSATLSKGPEEMAASLSAWFASMRTSNPILSASSTGNSENRLSENYKSPHSQDLSRSTIDMTRQLQMDPNRQLKTLQNMQSIQSAPWNACNLINNRNNVQQIEEYDSSEDVRVYMKPGSYNVPKKRHQRRPNKRVENPPVLRNPSGNITQNNSASTQRLQFQAVPALPPSSLSLDNSPRILRRVNSSSSHDFSQDVTWKAACASAEILLEALAVKEGEMGASEVKETPARMSPRPKCQDGGASSYEASEDDSGSTCKLSTSGLQSEDTKMSKTNIKTDSWLIRTLNNASIKQRQEPDLDSSESFNSSIHEDELVPGNSGKKLDTSLSRSREPRDEDQTTDLAEGIARATYSETVRRCASGNGTKESCRSRPQKATLANTSGTGNIMSARKCQRKESERSSLSYKSRKSVGKGVAKDTDLAPSEDSCVKIKLPKDEIPRLPVVKGHSKKKDAVSVNSGENGKNKGGDRGWSVWYSSRRRQSLSPLASRKLEAIHDTVWQMEEAEIFKYPPSNSLPMRSSRESSEDYYKVIKSPMFLETIGYKLKNKIYHKVEHVIRDFRRIIFNSRMYHKNDADRMARVEALSQKLDNLFDEHFTSWDFENITGSPRDGNGSPTPSRYKLPSQKATRSVNTKKSPSVHIDLDNSGSVH